MTAGSARLHKQQLSSEHTELNPVCSQRMVHASADVRGSGCRRDERHQELRFSKTLYFPCRHLQRRACRCLATCRGGLDCCGHPACAPTTRKVAGALLLHDAVRVVFTT